VRKNVTELSSSRQSLPPPIMTCEIGSFARTTIVERKPQIIGQVVADNGYPRAVVAALAGFKQEIAHQPIQPLTELAPDVAFWHAEAAIYRDRTWLELPWYFAETYFYRRLLEAVRYFQPGSWQGHDPFALQKRSQERAALAWLIENAGQFGDGDPAATFEALLHSALWGNRADLSNLTVREEVRGGAAARRERYRIIIDDTDGVSACLSAGVRQVDFVNDNTGRELLFDLVLADFLLEQGWVDRAVFHLKRQPFFVSDAMPQDVEAILALLDRMPLGLRLAGHLAAGRLVLRDDPFWTTCLMFRQMPRALSNDLARSDLVILKGDVNYRRLLDDAHWPHTSRTEAIAAYFPASFLVLRTLKGEIVVGLQPGQAEGIAAEDPTWLINGKRGIVQFVKKKQGTGEHVGKEESGKRRGTRG
jgi:uncharacterized protein with ATP-grasp and redox domains